MRLEEETRGGDERRRRGETWVPHLEPGGRRHEPGEVLLGGGLPYRGYHTEQYGMVSCIMPYVTNPYHSTQCQVWSYTIQHHTETTHLGHVGLSQVHEGQEGGEEGGGHPCQVYQGVLEGVYQVKKWVLGGSVSGAVYQV